MRRFPEVKQVVTKIGRPDVATEAMGIYQGDVYVNLHPRDEWKSGRTKEELIDAMADGARRRCRGSTFNFTQPMAMRLDEVVSGVKADVAVKVFGPDAATLERLGEEIRRVLDDGAAARPTCRSRCSRAPRRSRSTWTGRGWPATASTSRDVRELVETAVGGSDATEILDGPRRFDVVVRFPDELRGDPEAIAALLLTAPGGETVPLGNVARVGDGARARRRSTTRTASGGSSSRRTCAAATSAASSPRRSSGSARSVTLPAGLPRRVGRAVREPAARHAAADDRRSRSRSRSSSCCSS